jgi:hypothetical protein
MRDSGIPDVAVFLLFLQNLSFNLNMLQPSVCLLCWQVPTPTTVFVFVDCFDFVNFGLCLRTGNETITMGCIISILYLELGLFRRGICWYYYRRHDRHWACIGQLFRKDERGSAIGLAMPGLSLGVLCGAPVGGVLAVFKCNALYCSCQYCFQYVDFLWHQSNCWVCERTSIYQSPFFQRTDSLMNGCNICLFDYSRLSTHYLFAGLLSPLQSPGDCFSKFNNAILCSL